MSGRSVTFQQPCFSSNKPRVAASYTCHEVERLIAHVTQPNIFYSSSSRRIWWVPLSCSKGWWCVRSYTPAKAGHPKTSIASQRLQADPDWTFGMEGKCTNSRHLDSNSYMLSLASQTNHLELATRIRLAMRSVCKSFGTRLSEVGTTSSCALV